MLLTNEIQYALTTQVTLLTDSLLYSFSLPTSFVLLTVPAVIIENPPREVEPVALSGHLSTNHVK